MNTMGQLAKITETQQPTSAPRPAADAPQPGQPGADPNADAAAEAVTTKQGHLVTTILCQDVANSMTDNAPVIYRVLMAVRVDRLPFLQPLAVATFWLFDAPGLYHVGVRLLTPGTGGSEPGGGGGDRSVLLEAGAEVAVESPGTYHVSTFQFGDVALPLLGQYRAEVFLDGELVGAYPLFVQPRPGPQLEPQPQPQPELTEGAETNA
jgi:hypothetical protein